MKFCLKTSGRQSLGTAAKSFWEADPLSSGMYPLGVIAWSGLPMESARHFPFRHRAPQPSSPPLVVPSWHTRATLFHAIGEPCPPPPAGQHQSDTRWQTHSVAHTSLALRPLAPKRWSASGPSRPLFLAGAGLLSTTTWKSSRPTPSAAGCGRCWRAGQGQEAVSGVQVGGVAMLLKSGQPLLTPRSLILATPPRMAGMNGIRPFLQEYSIALAGPFPACQWGPPLTPFPPNRPCGSDPVTPWDPRKGQRFGFGPFF